jgi:hypothetical protein
MADYRRNTRAIRRITSGELLTKQTMRKILLNTKNMYILNLFLKVFITGIEAIVVSGNKFLYACVKEVCLLCAQPRFDAFRQNLFIVEVL